MDDTSTMCRTVDRGIQNAISGSGGCVPSQFQALAPEMRRQRPFRSLFEDGAADELFQGEADFSGMRNTSPAESGRRSVASVANGGTRPKTAQQPIASVSAAAVLRP
jgi:hypothetical protein